MQRHDHGVNDRLDPSVRERRSGPDRGTASGQEVLQEGAPGLVFLFERITHRSSKRRQRKEVGAASTQCQGGCET